MIAISPGSESGTINDTTNAPLESLFAGGMVSSGSPSSVIVTLCDERKFNPSIDTAVPEGPLVCVRKIDGDSLKNEASALRDDASVTVIM